MELAGKVIVIIGGTGGMGASATKACVRAGAKVVAVAERDAESLRELPPDACAFAQGDARDAATSESAIALAVEKFARFDALCHVAGGSGRSRGDGPLDAITDEGWQYTIDLNLKSLFNSNRAAVRQFLKQNTGGCVLNMSSVLAISPSPTFFSTHAYAAAKAGIIGLTRSAAAHYAARSIRFNVIAPGLIDTPMAARAKGDASVQQFIKTKQPLDGGRMGRPQDLDAAVVWLLSDAAKFVTGQVVSIDGGWSVSEGQVPT